MSPGRTNHKEMSVYHTTSLKPRRQWRCCCPRTTPASKPPVLVLYLPQFNTTIARSELAGRLTSISTVKISADGAWSVHLDYRGPGDYQRRLCAAIVHSESEANAIHLSVCNLLRTHHLISEDELR